MQIVTVGDTLAVPVEHGRSAITMIRDIAYVMHDNEITGGRPTGVFTTVHELPDRPAPFDVETTNNGRMIVPFIGGMGDAISMLPVLASLREQRPGLHVDVSATPGPAEIFALAPCVERIHAYPTPADEWRAYDHYLTMERILASSQPPGRPLPQTFAAALGIELTRPRVELNLPRAIEAVGEPSTVPLVGLAAGEGSSLRSYPRPKLAELVGELVRRGLGVVLLGHADPSWNVPVCRPIITDMRSRTPTVLELAVWLRAVDVVVCHDSFIMHLAGALARPTVGLFAPTAASHARPYPQAATIAAGAECAPCHAVGGACPRDLDCCVAWDDPALEPDAVAASVMTHLARQGRDVAGGGHGIAVAL